MRSMLAVILASVLIAAGSSSAQEREARVEAAEARLRDLDPKSTLLLDTKTGLPEIVTLPGGSQATQEIKDPVEAVEQFSENAGRLLFNLDRRDHAIEIVNSLPDPESPGQSLVRVQQMYGGVPVFGSEAVLVTSASLGVVALNTEFSVPVGELPPPRLNWYDALNRGTAAYKEVLASRSPVAAQLRAVDTDPFVQGPDLIVFDPVIFGVGARQTYAWRTGIGSYIFYIDATDGTILLKYANVQSIYRRKIDDCETRRGRCIGFIGETGALRDPSTAPPDLDQADRHLKAAYDYFSANFRRDGYDDNDAAGPNGGGIMRGYIRYGTDANASWTGREFRFASGFASASDVVGHEFTHALLQYQVGLEYFNEPGAINEALADFFGTMVEASQGTTNWLLGESLPGGRPLRDMSDPHMGGRFNRDAPFTAHTNDGQPDRQAEIVAPIHAICSNTTDAGNGCVHFNSGILNKAFSLAADGATFQGRQVSGMGRVRLARILYATSLRLTSLAKFNDFRRLAIESCDSLAGGDITEDNCTELDHAFSAVGI